MKKLVIEIEFRDKREVILSLEKILSQIKYNTANEGREVKDSYITDWSIQHHVNEEFDYSIQMINGIECMVIPSKMNRK